MSLLRIIQRERRISMTCPKCSAEIPDGSLFCELCGAKFEEAPAAAENPETAAAAGIQESPPSAAAPYQNNLPPAGQAPIAAPQAYAPHPQAAPPPQTYAPQPAYSQPAYNTQPPAGAAPYAPNTAPGAAPFYAPAPPPAPGKDLTKPLGVWWYILMFIVMSIPILNIVMVFAWSFGSKTNINRKNFARAVLILAIVSIVASVVLGVLFGAVMNDYLEDFMNEYGSAIPAFEF